MNEKKYSDTTTNENIIQSNNIRSNVNYSNNVQVNTGSKLNHFLRILSQLPCLNQKMAKKIGFHLLGNKHVLQNLISTLQDGLDYIKTCNECCVFTDNEKCAICRDAVRDSQQLCVVSDVANLISIENTKMFTGKYHILGGSLSKVDNILPEDLNLTQLLDRIKEHNVKHVLIALNPTIEGRATAYHIKCLLDKTDIVVTMLGIGIPFGGDLDYMDPQTIKEALKGKVQL